MSALYRKQTCYLCEMPRSPWAVVNDFTELVCRSCVNYEGADRIEAILTNARRMRGSYVESGGSKRESSAPYPVPRMGSSAARAELSNSTGQGEGGGGVGSPILGYSNQRVPPGSLSSIPLDGLDFMGRAPSLPGASSRPGPVGAQVLSMPGGFHQRAPSMQEVKMTGIRPCLPTTRPSSANSGAGQTGPNGPPTPGSRPDQVSSSSNGSNEVGGGPLLKCTNCRGKLEDTHFVQCPSNITHKFCFACCRDSIIKQGSEAFCPSGERCPLQGSTVPWAFMQEEIETILGEKSEPGQDKK